MTVHVERESTLARKLNVRTLPTLAVIVNGKPYIYREPLSSASKVVGKNYNIF